MNWEFKRLFIRLYSNTKRLFKDLTYDVKEAFKEVFWRFPRNICFWVIKVAQYSRILYQDRDWDYICLLKLMQYKISRMRKNMSHGYVADNEKYCAQMQEAEELIGKLLEDDWAKAEREAHDTKWGELHIESIPIPNQQASECRFLRLNVRTDKDNKQERKEYNKIMDLEVERKKAAWNRLFYLLKNHMEKWWD
jgi:hypothetical protein